MDLVHAEARPVLFVCDDYRCGCVPHGLYHLESNRVLTHVYLVVINLVALQHALGAVALNAAGNV